ncbi:hypothetical protein TRICI_005938 [Trichomonascus ciferrii]|uniref:ATP-dependent RNA helicase n=1 Tax=Trichomonascus ciferrii TaxID=44093 RepID=A0A642UNB8_9ASCO|nr:hypothetical protein TRICI_005938 [Trichomonascus ciferrii]
MGKKGKQNREAKVNLRKKRVEEERKRLAELESNVKEFELDGSITKFSQLPVSKYTMEGLKMSHFTSMTDIQQKAIVPALKGQDILGAARTGSGKTLAFLIPVMELLYRNAWNSLDGLGALIISPTRELAIQIFDVLRKIGRSHQLSAGLVIGGKDPQVEAERISKLNILIGTPGRILHHMHKTSSFDVSNLQMLVLDEADRILDMGFKHDLNAIVQDLPSTRQTLLFSATQTKSVSDLARLSLSDPAYISAHDLEPSATPKGLEQYYVVTEVDQKLNTLYGFLKSHLKSKVLVFFSSSKQVRFVYETFRKLQPGIPLLHLHGRQKQAARIDVTDKFTAAQHSCLFATDVCARGMDFPGVEWVIQADAPEDAATYIHRVGRSARFDKKGRALMFLTPSEEVGMVNALEKRKVPVAKLNVKESKKKDITQDLQALCFKDPEIKYLGQKAFISYVRSVNVQHDKEIFNVNDIPFEKLAASFGLPGAPKVKISSNSASKAREQKNMPRELLRLAKGDDDEKTSEQDEEKVKTKYDRMFERRNQNVLSEHYMKLQKDADIDDNGDNENEEDGFMTVKRKDHNITEEEIPDLTAPVSKRQQKKALSKKQLAKSGPNPKKLVFDDEGNAHELYEMATEEDFRKAGATEEQIQEFLGKESAQMQQRDIEDKQLARDKRQEKKRRRKEKEREAVSESEDDDEGVQLAEPEPDLDRDMESSSPESSDDDDEEERSRPAKKPKTSSTKNKVLEVEEPTTLEDLEALSSRLIQNN